MELGDAAFADGDVDAILGRLAKLDGDDAAEARRSWRRTATAPRRCLLAEKSVGLGFEGALALEADASFRGWWPRRRYRPLPTSLLRVLASFPGAPLPLAR